LTSKVQALALRVEALRFKALILVSKVQASALRVEALATSLPLLVYVLLVLTWRRLNSKNQILK